MTNGSTKGAEDVARATAEQAAQAFAMNLQMGKTFMDAWTQTLQQYQQAAQQNAQRAAQSAWPAPQGFMPFGFGMPTPPAPQAQSAQPNLPGMGAVADVTRIWINAVNEAMRRTQDAVQQGKPVTPDTFLDLWTKAASELSQAVVSDAAFATLTGQWVNAVSAAKTQAKDAATDQLRELGFATHTDVEEVGKRLIELERRVHDLMIALEDQQNGGAAKKGGAKAKKSGE